MAQSRRTAFPRAPYIDGMTVEQREQWIYANERETDNLANRIHLLIGLDYSLILLLPEAQLLEWVETCVHLGVAGHSQLDITEMVKELKKLQADHVTQWNYLTQQLHNYPDEWHRFQQTQIPYLQKQQKLRAQAAQKRAEAKQCKKTSRPPTACNCQPPTRYPVTPEGGRESEAATNAYARCMTLCTHPPARQ
jgi:hypothetical protein